MFSLLIVAATAVLVSLALTPLCRDLAIRFGLLDQPDNERKIHRTPIPRVGGVPIAIAFLASVIVLFVLEIRGADLIRGNLGLLLKLCPGAALIFGVGLVDDLLGLKPREKLIGQILAALVVFNSGVHFASFGATKFPVWIALPLTLVWLVGCTNAINLIDGLDGLASGVGLFTTGTVFIAALFQHNWPLMIATAPLVGALLGFLRYNFNPATIFLGDSGSLLIGFLLGCYGLSWSEKLTSFVGITAPMIAFCIPLLDTCLSISRRFLRRKPIFGADRGHIHHKLLAHGLPPRSAALSIYLACALCAVLSLASVVHEKFAGLISVSFLILVWVAIKRLGYQEFVTARRLAFSGTFRRTVDAQLKLQSFGEALKSAGNTEQCWDVLSNSYAEFGFLGIRLKLSGDSYTHSHTGHALSDLWAMRIELSETEYLNLYRGWAESYSAAAVPFAETAAKLLQAKLGKVADEVFADSTATTSGTKPISFASNSLSEPAA